MSDAFSDGVTEDDELVVLLPLDVDRTGLEQERKLWFLLVGWCLPPPFRSFATDAGDHRGGEGGKRGGREAGKTTARREGGGVTWAALAGKKIVV